MQNVVMWGDSDSDTEAKTDRFKQMKKPEMIVRALFSTQLPNGDL